MCMNGRENLCLKQFVVCRSSCDYRGGYVTNIVQCSGHSNDAVL